MISDFMLDSASNITRARIADLKDNYNRFHSLVVGTMPNLDSQDIFDNVMYYDPNDPYATQQIVKSLNDTLKDLRELKDEEVEYREKQIKELNDVRDKKRARQVVDAKDVKPSKKAELMKKKEKILKEKRAALSGLDEEM
jgi:hypothetical protein